MGLALTVLAVMELFLLAGIAGRKLDTRSIKDREGQTYITRERNASFYHSVVLIGIMSAAAGYFMSLAASWTLDYGDFWGEANFNPGIIAAVGILVVVEVLLVITAISHERGIVLAPADLRAEISQLVLQGAQSGGPRLEDLKSRLEAVKDENARFRSRRKLSDTYQRNYESLFTCHEEMVKMQPFVLLKREHRSVVSWIRCFFSLEGLMLAKLHLAGSLVMAILLTGAVIVSICFSTNEVTCSFTIVLVVSIIVTYLIDSKNALMKLAKGQVLFQAQIAICDRLITGLDVESVEVAYRSSYRIGKWLVLRRR